MTAALSAVINYDNWLPLAEVRHLTGLCERSIYRLASEGRLRKTERSIPGRNRPLSVYHPEDVRGIVQAQASKTTVLAPIPARRELSVRHEVEVRRPPAIAPHALNFSDLQIKRFLTEDEAASYTGMGKVFLRKVVTPLPNGPRGALIYRREDLEAL